MINCLRQLVELFKSPDPQKPEIESRIITSVWPFPVPELEQKQAKKVNKKAK